MAVACGTACALNAAVPFKASNNTFVAGDPARVAVSLDSKRTLVGSRSEFEHEIVVRNPYFKG